MPAYCDCGIPDHALDDDSACDTCGGIIVKYCDCENPDLIEDGSTSICAGCGDVVRDDTPKPDIKYCDCGTLPSGADGIGQTCGGCGRIVCDIPPDPQESRIRELEQELATVRCDCRLAGERLGAKQQKLEEAEESCRDLVDRLADAEGRNRELEVKTDKPVLRPDQRACPKCGGLASTTRFYRTSSIKASTYRSLEVHKACAILACPEDEHMHVTCCRCEYVYWQHCADHVEDRAKTPSICMACDEEFTPIAKLQSSKRGLCPSCWANQE